MKEAHLKFVAVVALAGFSGFSRAADLTPDLRRPHTPVLLAAPSKTDKPVQREKLPPLPPGVEDLRFNEFFKTPVGPRGLELTDRLRAMDGKHVRVLGFMVRESLEECDPGEGVGHTQKPTVNGRMMLTPVPCAVNFADFALCDDLPPQTLFVRVPDRPDQVIPYTPGPLLLTGTLSVGNKPEPDGRISVVRLLLDLPAAPPVTGPATKFSSHLGANP